MVTYKQLMLFYRERSLFLFFNIALTALVLSAVWIIISVGIRRELIPLHYTIFFGIDWIGSWSQLWYMWIGVASCIIANGFFAYRIFTRDKYLSYYLVSMSSVVSILYVVYVVTLSMYAL